MKTLRRSLLLIIIHVSIVINTVQGQNYHPFPEVNAFWTVAEFNWQIGDYDTYIYTIKGDTLLNGKSYKKVFKLSDIPNSQDTLWTLHNFMRQDIINKRIYFIRHYQNETIEKLGYDFDVEIGDTVLLPAFDYENAGDSIFEVLDTSWDSTLLWNGEYRQNYFFVSVDPFSSFTLFVIEGVGTQRTPFPNLFVYDAFHQSEIVCHLVNGDYLYGASPYPDECDFSVGISEKLNNVTFLCYPLPASESISIRFPKHINGSGKLQLINSMGYVVLNRIIQLVDDDYTIVVSSLPAGIYYLAFSNNVIKYSQIIIINH